MNEELKPCPFCGGKAELLKLDVSEYFVHCPNPNCFIGQDLLYRSKKTAIKKWNRRMGERESK